MLKEKLINEELIHTHLLRIYETFEHVITIDENILQKALDKCREYEIQCEIIHELPFIYESPLVNIYKNL